MKTGGDRLEHAASGAVAVSSALLPTTRHLEVRRFDGAIPNEILEALERTLPPAMRFLAHQWFPAWFKTQVPLNRWCGPSYCYVAFDSSGEPTGIMPFAHQRYGPFRIPTLAGYYFPFRAPLFADNCEPEIASAIVATMRSSIRLALRIGPTCRTHRAVEALMSSFHSDGWTLIRIERGMEYIVDLPDTVERFRAANMSANLRSSIGRKSRRMQRQAGVRLECYSALTPEAWGRVIEDMAHVEERSWVGLSNGFLHFHNTANAAFWRTCLTGRMSAAAHAAVLYLDDQPAAFEFWFDSGDTRYFIAGLHDSRVTEHSPGYFLMQLMLEDAISRGLKRANLGQGDAGYKSRFGALPSGFIDDWVVIRPGTPGRVVRALWNARLALAERMPHFARPSHRGESALSTHSMLATSSPYERLG